MYSQIREMLEYNKWATYRLLSDLDGCGEIYSKLLPVSFGSIHGLCVHLHYYDQKLFQKLLDGIKAAPIDKSITKSQLLKEMLLQADSWLDWFDQQEASNVSISTIKEITQLYNHNIYHRGQISAVLAMEGVGVSSLDVYRFQAEQVASMEEG